MPLEHHTKQPGKAMKAIFHCQVRIFKPCFSLFDQYLRFQIASLLNFGFLRAMEQEIQMKMKSGIFRI